MNHEQVITQTEAQQLMIEGRDDERQPWHRPRLKRLRLSLDTAAEIGSTTDAFQTGSSTSGPR